MSKCPKCGAEAEAGMNFCLECGTKIPQDKECPACHARWPVSAKFCAECGHPFVESAGSGGGPAVGIGDKNVIAGDVSLSNTTNTTNYINQDETRRVVKCAACGKSIVITEAFSCVECGEYVCADHYDKAHRKCMACHAKQVESAESKYRAKLDVILEDGIIDADEFEQLEALRKELGLTTTRSLELQKQAKAARLAKTSAKTVDRPLMMVEKAQCERARQMLFEDGECQKAVALLESIHQNHPVNEAVLEVFLTALQMFDAERARKIIGELPVDLVIAYLTLVDLELKKGDLAEAERKLASAESLWPDNTLVKYRRVALMYATAKELNNRTFLVEAMDILTSIPEPTDKLEKSWGFYLQYLISKQLGDEVPAIDKAFCQEQGVYYSFASGMIVGLPGRDENIKKPKEKPRVSEPSQVAKSQAGSIDWAGEMITIPGRRFKLGRTQVTQAQWKLVMGGNPSFFKGDERPVEQVSWNDCQLFIAKLNELTGLTFRLPTGEEWEFAGLAGGNGRFGIVEDGIEGDPHDMGWHTDNSANETHPVAQKQPNAWGLYDMHGNVWEWCEDEDQGRRLRKGGSFSNLVGMSRANFGLWTNPNERGNRTGLRLALSFSHH